MLNFAKIFDFASWPAREHQDGEEEASSPPPSPNPSTFQPYFNSQSSRNLPHINLSPFSQRRYRHPLRNLNHFPTHIYDLPGATQILFQSCDRSANYRDALLIRFSRFSASSPYDLTDEENLSSRFLKKSDQNSSQAKAVRSKRRPSSGLSLRTVAGALE